MAGPFVLSPGRILHLVRERSTRCYAAMLISASNPTVATLRNMEDDAITRNTPHSVAENNATATWHTPEECRARWPAVPAMNEGRR